MEKYELEIIQEKAKDFHEQYLNDDEWGLPREKRLNKIKDELVRRFTTEYVQNEMRKEDYCIGHSGDKDNFCYIIERTLRGLGSILGASSKKFGLYWSKKEGRYIPTDRYGATEDGAFNKIKAELVKIIYAAQRNDMNAISSSTFSYMIRHKIFFLYNSSTDIPIFSEDHLEKVLAFYDIPYLKDNYTETNKRRALYNFKENNEVFSEMTNKEFMSFLYSEYSGLDLKQKKTIDENRKGETVVLVEVTSLLDTHEQHEYKSRKGKTNYDDIAAHATFVGEAGEKLVLDYEKRNNRDYARKIKWVSRYDDHAGYDILSYDKDGNKIFIEVKTKKYGGADNIDFYITDNELKRLREDNHIIYYVCGITRKQKKIYAIRKETLDQVEPQPILYRVFARAVN